jgi:hypothetical protein
MTTEKPKHKMEDNMKMDLIKVDMRVWNGFMWLRIVNSGVPSTI